MKPISTRSRVRGELTCLVDRYLHPLFAREEDHVRHMRRVALVLAIVVGVIFLLNRQWLRDSTLMNSPSFDALVYQIESYVDYSLIRSEGLSALVTKYTAGYHHTPPLLVLSGTIFYLLFGRDPANFYILPAICLYLMLFGTYGFLHYWTERRGWAILGAAMLLTTHSVLSFGLRVSQTDFAVGAVYSLTIYFLVVSEGLLRRRASLLFALSVSACVLLKSSIVPYFLAHALIWLLYLVVSDPKQRSQRLLNTVLVGGIVLALAGWFYFTNYQRILTYYTRWGGELSQVTRSAAGITSVIDDMTFYLWSFRAFHLTRNVEIYVATVVAAAAGCGVMLLLRARGALAERRIWFGLGIACIWLIAPYSILSMYGSKAVSVDFPFLATFFVIPLMLVAALFSGRYVLIGMLVFVPFLALQSRAQIQNLVQGPPSENWRERQVLSDIFQDADQRGLREVVVVNAFVHLYLTSQNLQYFVVNGTFPEWIDRYKILPIGHFFDVQEYYDELVKADYILTKSGNNLPSTHPNNVLAPEVSQLLAKSPDLVPIQRYELPDASELVLYRNAARSGFGHPGTFADGWIGPRYPLTFYGEPKEWRIQIVGRLVLAPGASFPAQVYLEDEHGELVSDRALVKDDRQFSIRLTVPASALSASGERTVLYLMTDRVHRPSDVGSSTDSRELMMVLTSITEAKP